MRGETKVENKIRISGTLSCFARHVVGWVQLDSTLLIHYRIVHLAV